MSIPYSQTTSSFNISMTFLMKLDLEIDDLMVQTVNMIPSTWKRSVVYTPREIKNLRK